MIGSDDISGIFNSPAHILFVKLIELISAVVLISVSLEPPWHISANLSASSNWYEGCTIISLLSRITSVFLGMVILAEKSWIGS